METTITFIFTLSKCIIPKDNPLGKSQKISRMGASVRLGFQIS